jgi:hypothetical protein
MSEVEVISLYQTGWSLREVKEMPVRERRYWMRLAYHRMMQRRG